jgi:hypothetical protein
MRGRLGAGLLQVVNYYLIRSDYPDLRGTSTKENSERENQSSTDANNSNSSISTGINSPDNSPSREPSIQIVV